ncbi:unnamed protein product [Polarella glacialis]|uniref:Uncharacterized protein n=1 Tax=Polarella glacialis TaxID=89957 RepID=A0A813FJD5_POLGL|nr:unnamed protein product [Polarella glacialis]
MTASRQLVRELAKRSPAAGKALPCRSTLPSSRLRWSSARGSRLQASCQAADAGVAFQSATSGSLSSWLPTLLAQHSCPANSLMTWSEDADLALISVSVGRVGAAMPAVPMASVMGAESRATVLGTDIIQNTMPLNYWNIYENRWNTIH